MLKLPNGYHFFERGWLSSNSLLIQNADHSVLIDSGYFTQAEQLINVVGYQLKSQPLDMLLNTHLHSDHCGGNSLLQTHYPNLETHIPYSQIKVVEAWDHHSLTFDLTGQTCPIFSATHGLLPDSFISLCGTPWRIFSSPGHDNDALLFFEPDHGILISADALWEKGMGVVFPEFIGGIGFEYVASTYDLIESLSPQLVLPGHGPAFSNVTKSLADARQRLDEFCKSPEKHAMYAAKVLIKFKLLECHSFSTFNFINWCCESPLLLHIHESYFETVSLKLWIESLLMHLADRRVIEISGGTVFNV